MSATPESLPDGHRQRASDIPHFRYAFLPNEKDIRPVSQTLPTGKVIISRKLQRIDMILNLVHLRVANDRSLQALLPHISEHEAYNLVSNFTYVRHQQDTQELKSEMTDKQTYRIFRHHYRAEQRLSDAVRELRHSTTKTYTQQPSETSPESKSVENPHPLTQAVVDLENDTATMRVHHLEQVNDDLKEMSHVYQSDDDLLYIQEFSQAQQISTMQARCMAMKDEYEADDMRKGRFSWIVSSVKKVSNETISGPEEREDDPSRPRVSASTVTGFGVMNGEWTPPDPPRSPCPNERQCHRAGATVVKYATSEDSVHEAGESYAEDKVSPTSYKEYRPRRSGRQPSNDQSEDRHERRKQRTFRNPDTYEKKAQTSGFPDRRDRRDVSPEKSSPALNPKRKNGAYHENLHSRQRRSPRHRAPLPDHNQDRKQRLHNHKTQSNSKRPGRLQRTSRAHMTPKGSLQAANHATAGQPKYHYSNAEHATMPNLRRNPRGYHRETSYDDGYVPLQGGSGRSQYQDGYSLDPFQKPFPHESTDAFGWKPLDGSTGNLYPSANATPGQPVSTKTRKRDEWRYNNGFSSGLLDSKESLGVMHSIADKVKGRKPKAATPHNPIEAMQLARKDPVKFMTTMVAGEVLPQAKRKAHKFESMLANEAKVGGVTGQVGHMLTKVAKESLTQGGPSKTGVSGQVGQALAKMTLDSAMGGGSSKANVTSQVGNVLAKVAKDSVKHAGGSSNGTGMIKQVVNSLTKA